MGNILTQKSQEFFSKMKLNFPIELQFQVNLLKIFCSIHVLINQFLLRVSAIKRRINTKHAVLSLQHKIIQLSLNLSRPLTHKYVIEYKTVRFSVSTYQTIFEYLIGLLFFLWFSLSLLKQFIPLFSLSIICFCFHDARFQSFYIAYF